MEKTPEPDRQHSRLLRFDRRANGQPLKAAIEGLVGQLETAEVDRKRRRRTPERERLTETMETIVSDLYVARDNDPELWLGYSRNQNDYLPLPRYRTDRTTYSTATTVADFLIASGYAEGLPGYYRRASSSEDAWTNGGMRSRLRATEQLEAFLWEDHGALARHTKIARSPELIRLKDASKQLIGYCDTPETIRMREELEGINKLIENTTIEAPRAPEGINPDQTAKTLYRVFNDGRFDRGGRFYGGWWINAKSDHRSKITINGQPNVELDFSAHHLRLCYHLSGLPAPDREDLYALEGTEGLRKAVKWAVMILLNLSPGKRMPRPDSGLKELMQGRMTTAELRRLVEAGYPEIRDWFGAGRGTELQCIDGRIAASILNDLALHGIPCLPVHDSFIVEQQHQSLLLQSMTEAYTTELYLRTGQTSYPTING